MNCDIARQNLLLAESDELTPDGCDALERHIADCAPCRAYRIEMDRMVTAFRDVRLDRDVRDDTLRSIRKEAEAEPGGAFRRSPAREESIVTLWRPALVYAAAAVVLILVGTPFIRRSAPELSQAPERRVLTWNSTFDSELDDVYDLLALAEGDSSEGAARRDTLDEIADDLLDLEDWQI